MCVLIKKNWRIAFRRGVFKTLNNFSFGNVSFDLFYILEMKYQRIKWKYFNIKEIGFVIEREILKYKSGWVLLMLWDSKCSKSLYEEFLWANDEKSSNWYLGLQSVLDINKVKIKKRKKLWDEKRLMIEHFQFNHKMDVRMLFDFERNSQFILTKFCMKIRRRCHIELMTTR